MKDHPHRIPLEDATKEELIAVIRDRIIFTTGIEQIERQICYRRQCRLLDQVRPLVAELDVHSHKEGEPFNPEKRRRWLACMEKIDALNRRLNILQDINLTDS